MFPPAAIPAGEPAPGPPGGGALLLHAGGGRWRVTLSSGAEVAACPPVAALPGAPRWLAGVTVHKGAALALVDLAVLLPDADPEAVARARRRVLVTRLPGVALGFAVDDVDADREGSDIATLDLEALIPRLLGLSAEAVP